MHVPINADLMSWFPAIFTGTEPLLGGVLCNYPFLVLVEDQSGSRESLLVTSQLLELLSVSETSI